MFDIIINSSSAVSELQDTYKSAKSKFVKRLALIGLVVISIFALVSFFTLFQSFPLGIGVEASELRLDYTVGERMTYEVDIGIQFFGSSISESVEFSMEVQDFDGEIYTICYTVSKNSEESSFIMKLNKTGQVLEKSEISEDLEDTFDYLLGLPGFGAYFTEEPVKVGDSWTIPLDFPDLDFNGEIRFELVEITKMVVPAGSYDILKIEIRTSNFDIETEDAQIRLLMDGFFCMEKDSCRLINSSLDISVETLIDSQPSSFNLNMQMNLVEHLKP